MKLPASTKAWAPEDRPDLLLILNEKEAPPKALASFLLSAARTLALLVSEADEPEIESASNRLRDLLPEEFKLALPSAMLGDPQTPSLLYLNPAPPDSNLSEWKAGLAEALRLPPMPKAELDAEVEQVSLESYLSPIT